MNKQTDLFDDDCLQRVKQTLNNTETPEFPQSDWFLVCVGVLRPSQQRGHVEPVS